MTILVVVVQEVMEELNLLILMCVKSIADYKGDNIPLVLKENISNISELMGFRDKVN